MALPLPPGVPPPPGFNPCAGVIYSPASVLSSISYPLKTPSSTSTSNLNFVLIPDLSLDWNLTKTIGKIPVITTSCKAPPDEEPDDVEIDDDEPLGIDIPNNISKPIQNAGAVILSGASVVIDNTGFMKPLYNVGINTAENVLDTISKGVPCDFKIVNRRRCIKIFKKRICRNIPLPVPSKYIFRVHTKDDYSAIIPLFRFPEIRFKGKISATASAESKVSLISNTPIPFWIDVLVTMLGGLASDQSDVKTFDQVVEKLLVANKKSLSNFLMMSIKQIITKNIFGGKFIPTLTLLCRIHDSYLNLKLNMEDVEISFGSQKLSISSLTEDIKIPLFVVFTGAEFGVLNNNVVFDAIIGTFDVADAFFFWTKTKCKAQIAAIKLIPDWEKNPLLKYQVDKLEKTLATLDDLENFVVPTVFPGQPKIKIFQKFGELTSLKVTVSLRVCGQTGLVAICGKVVFDTTKFFQYLSGYLNEFVVYVKKHRKYNKFTKEQCNAFPPLIGVNAAIDLAHRGYVKSVEAMVNGIITGLDTMQITSSVQFCCPPL